MATLVNSNVWSLWWWLLTHVFFGHFHFISPTKISTPTPEHIITTTKPKTFKTRYITERESQIIYSFIKL